MARTHGGERSEHRDLRERRKELACLTGVCGLFALRGRSLEQILAMAASLVASGWQYPDKAVVRIRLGDIDVGTAELPAAARRLRRTVSVGSRARGAIEVAYPRETAPGAAAAFLPTERNLLEAVAALLGTMAELAAARDELARRAEELRARRRVLRRKNIALREMLSQLELEKRQMAERVQANAVTLVGPAVARLARSGLTAEARRRLVAVARKHLEQITSGLGGAVSAAAARLSPREVEVCDLIRTGLSNKEIAPTLGVSLSTVERHRHNIRRKLGLAGASTNLATYLAGMR
jgi:DNA-binding NarL/FixJ family response regulator